MDGLARLLGTPTCFSLLLQVTSSVCCRATPLLALQLSSTTDLAPLQVQMYKPIQPPEPPSTYGRTCCPLEVRPETHSTMLQVQATFTAAGAPLGASTIDLATLQTSHINYLSYLQEAPSPGSPAQALVAGPAALLARSEIPLNIPSLRCRAPPLLAVHLKRFQQDLRGRLSKIRGPVPFPFTLDLSSVCDPKVGQLRQLWA